MYQTINFNYKSALFTQIDANTLQLLSLSSNCYINNRKLMSDLSNIELPLKNRNKSIKKILEFLIYLEHEVKLAGKSTLIIPQQVFESYFSPNSYCEYQKILKDLKILTNVPHDDGSWYVYYDKKKFETSKTDLSLAKNYRVHNNYLDNDDLVLIIFNNKNKKSVVTVTNEIHKLPKKYVNTIKNLKINIGNALQAELNEYHRQKITFLQLKYRVAQIFNSRNNRTIKHGKKVNRIYHSFTNISKVTRKHFNINFFEIDVTNCQPTLLVAYLMDNQYKLDMNYQTDCENGTFYERFIDLTDDRYSFGDDLGVFKEARSTTKAEIYKSIFFGFNRRNKYNKRFREIYPNVWESLSIIKDEKSSLAAELQNIESLLFNNLVPKISKYYYTLHDAIFYSNDEDTWKLEQQIVDFFGIRNIKVKIEKR